jgi:hypothetical protein
MENRAKQDGIRPWREVVIQYDSDDDKMSELRDLKTS